MFIVDDDFLPKSIIENLKNLQTIPFYYHKSSCYQNKDYSIMKARGCDHKHPQFVHTLYNDNKVESDLFENVVGIIVKNFFEKYNISEKTIIRAKVNMTTKSSSNKKTTPHIDYPYNHYVMIYYVDDSDGDTVIYKQKYGQKRLWLSEYKRIKPKAGRCVIFDGLHYHSPSLPKNHQSRCVLNINFID